MKALTSKEFDNLRAVLTCLRHDCQHVKSTPEAIKIISKKLDIEPEVVKELIIRIFGK